VTTIRIHFLGGTIGYAGAANGEPVRLGPAALLAAAPGLDRLGLTLDVHAADPVPSASLTFAQLSEVAREAAEACGAGTADAVVVVQGTDTLEESAYLLDLLWDRPEPMVLTGAMRNPTLAGADGPANLLAAVQVAAAPAAGGMGAMVVFNDEIHAARFVRKGHTSSPSTFRSVTAGPIGWVVEGRPRIGLCPVPLQRDVLARPAGDRPVALLTCVLGDDLRLVGELERLGYAGAVIDSFGGGHVPGHVVPALAEVAARIPVVLASRTGGGEVLQETYGFPGSERDLLARGLIPAGFLDGRKARILLSLLLADGTDPAVVRTSFQRFLDAAVASDRDR